MAAAGAPSLAEIERLCLSLYSPQCPSDERRRCELLLDHVFSPVPFSDVAVLPAQDIPLTPRPSVETSVHLVFTLLGSSSSVYAQLYALNSLTRNISRHFYSLDLLHKTELSKSQGFAAEHGERGMRKRWCLFQAEGNARDRTSSRHGHPAPLRAFLSTGAFLCYEKLKPTQSSNQLSFIRFNRKPAAKLCIRRSSYAQSPPGWPIDLDHWPRDKARLV
jgi:hypothetical protein